MKSKLTTSNITIGVIILIVTIVSSNLNWSRNHWKGILEADAKGYYAYLPAVVIYDDLNFGFFDEIEKDKYYNKNLFYNYRSSSNGKIINKYYCGTALAELPFFLVAHMSSYLLDYETDRYSKLYPILINIGAVFYLLLGLIYLNASMKKYEISERHRAITMFASLFGTNLFYYVVGESGMSHAYSFGFIAMFFYYALQYFSNLQKKNILKLALLLGVIILIRPVNGLVVFVLPFAAGNYDALKKGFFKLFENKLWLLLSFCSLIAIVSIQLIIYKISTGSFFTYSYGNEGFNFLSPHIFDILFSYKKGLFLYTPLLLLSLFGGWFLWKSSRYKFYTWFGFFAIITYVFSSWWNWWYGGSFSSRVYVEYISIFMILMGIALKEINVKKWSRLFLLATALTIIVCQIQTYQYRYYEIHWSGMTKAKYWDVFMRIDKLIK